MTVVSRDPADELPPDEYTVYFLIILYTICVFNETGRCGTTASEDRNKTNQNKEDLLGRHSNFRNFDYTIDF